jgi:oxygen-independent coproporphyrinogen-3 oxidase
MVRRSFERVRYRLTSAPPLRLAGSFGIYVHVPFCHSKCSFCPFYKELFSETDKNAYLNALASEIEGSGIRGKASWVYFGGGTPNTLTVSEIARILSRLKERVRIEGAGIELLPSRLTPDYLAGLRSAGFTKISIGVESLSDAVLQQSGRHPAPESDIAGLIEQARRVGLRVNVDLMVGLPGQDGAGFLNDVQALAAIRPDQVTTYPFMVIRGLKVVPSLPERRQFELIEKAHQTFSEQGYARKSVWTFARDDDIYDSSRDELVADYVGFGPAAFSTYGDWKVVNPDLATYLRGAVDGRRLAFVARKTKSSDDWRRLARMIYDLEYDEKPELPAYFDVLARLLETTGHIRRGKLTAKGAMFAHALTKAVVESLPFPIQNPSCVVPDP